jgi:hypothetical protein
MVKAGRKDDLRRILLDFNYLQAKLAATDTNAALVRAASSTNAALPKAARTDGRVVALFGPTVFTLPHTPLNADFPSVWRH